MTSPGLSDHPLEEKEIHPLDPPPAGDRNVLYCSMARIKGDIFIKFGRAPTTEMIFILKIQVSF